MYIYLFLHENDNFVEILTLLESVFLTNTKKMDVFHSQYGTC